jgi:hypothetical protein
MASKYAQLTKYLVRAPADKEIALDLATLEAIVGGLPPSSLSPAWWANTPGHTQAQAWLSAGRQVRAELAAGRVVFSAVGTATQKARSATARRVPPILNGVEALAVMLGRARYASVVAAIAEHTVFLDPKTVAQTHGAPVFRVIRNMLRRGQVDTLPDGRQVLLDDNTTPTWSFLWAAARNKGLDVQYNHVWSDAGNPELYTALWNLCATPAFLAKTTDGQNHPEVRAALQYRSYQLYGTHPGGHTPPAKPEGFDQLQWALMPEPVANLELVYRTHLAAAPKSRMAFAARTIGWLFSSWQPDQTLGVQI